MRTTLRRKAEKSLKIKKYLPAKETTIVDKDKLLHELQVHQLELEMQNEELQRIQLDLEESRNKYANLYDFAPIGYFTLDYGGNVHEVNHSGSSLLALSKRYIIGRRFQIFISPESQDDFYKFLMFVFNTDTKQMSEFKLINKEGTIIYARIEAISFFDKKNNGRRCQIVIMDLSEHRKAEEHIKYISFHDKITDLYNWTYFEEELRRIDTQRGLPLSVIIGDMNNLKLTNDAFGHQEGDNLLRLVANIMKESCRNEDVIARWGGDEFAILLPRTDHKTAKSVVNRISEKCRQCNKAVILCSIALGVATKKTIKQNVKDVIRLSEERMYKNKVLNRGKNRKEVFDAIFNKIGTADHETSAHIKRLQRLAVKTGEAIGMSKKKINDLILFAALHDVGKAAIPESILSKPGTLSTDEWDTIKKHPEIGYHIANVFPDMSRVADAILSHHEHWDGSGYPHRLKEYKIPLLVRILSIVDAYDVMTHKRVYKELRTHQEAVKELEQNAGKQFDPELVKLFVGKIINKGTAFNALENVSH